MPVPAFTIDGVLPPFVGPTGPGGASSDMSPYEVTCLRSSALSAQQRTAAASSGAESIIGGSFERLV